EQANFEKSRFLANMSHEIRTPLNSIHGMSEILKDTKMTKDQKEIVETIIDSSKILVRILNDILDISKIESGKISVENSNFNIISTIKTLTNPFEMKYKDSDIDFILELIPENIECDYSGDSLKLAQILNNLLSNAAKFTKKGYIKLTVKMISDSESVSRFEFSVSDTGVGIDKKDLNKIFDRFTQADISTTRKYGGTGLGLTISKKLVEILGGELKVESGKGTGSRFFFRLDIKKAKINDNLNRGDNTESEKVRTCLKNIKILVAEDNIFNQKYISTLLSKKDIDFKIVENGREVLEELENDRYDIILMDGQMPVMDGIETSKTIRKSRSGYSQIPIIALTASALIDDRRKFLDAGMNDFISKPVEQSALFRTVGKYCFKDEKILTVKEPGDRDHLSKKDNSGEWIILDIDDYNSKKKIFGEISFADILSLFEKELPLKIARIEDSLRKNDKRSLKFEAHSLKGVSLNFKAQKFNDLCSKLDRYAQSGDTELSKKIFRDLKALSTEYRKEITEYIQSIKK
ncbi:MAG: ATP-binding protein, partial [Candidatus Delongbacteria bacterium]